jgi:hypothetical protein
MSQPRFLLPKYEFKFAIACRLTVRSQETGLTSSHSASGFHAVILCFDLSHIEDFELSFNIYVFAFGAH